MLSSRGLHDSQSLLPGALLGIGYFRLSGYWRYFQVDPANGRNNFQPGSDFANILDLHEYDAVLRNLLLEGLAEIEIALRAILVAHTCAIGGTGTEYLEASSYRKSYDKRGALLRDKLLADLWADINRSKEAHVLHHRAESPQGIPLWVAVEALSFGVLSRMCGLLDSEDISRRIAERFGYSSPAHFRTNLRSVTVLRNRCAHHSRVWNIRVRQDVPRIFPKLIDKELVTANYLNTPWGVIAVAADLVGQVRGDTTFLNALSRLVPRGGLYWTGLISPSNK